MFEEILDHLLIANFIINLISLLIYSLFSIIIFVILHNVTPISVN